MEGPAGKKIKVEPTKDNPAEALSGKRHRHCRARAEVPETEPKLNRGWCQKERDILVQLENVDKEKVISWNELWDRASSALRDAGHNRSPGACNNFWKRYQKDEYKSVNLINDQIERPSTLGTGF
jgi:hypothetical protein